MAKWRRGGGGRGRARWVIEWVPVEIPITPKVKEIPDPYEYDDPYQIRQALAAMENCQLSTEEETAIADG